MNTTTTAATKAFTVDGLKAEYLAMGLPLVAAEAAAKAAMADLQAQANLDRLLAFTTKLDSFNGVEVTVLQGIELYLGFNKLVDSRMVITDGQAVDGPYIPAMFAIDVTKELDTWFNDIEKAINDSKMFANNSTCFYRLIDAYDADDTLPNRFRLLAQARQAKKEAK
jgi:hypothetical protein